MNDKVKKLSCYLIKFLCWIISNLTYRCLVQLHSGARMHTKQICVIMYDSFWGWTFRSINSQWVREHWRGEHATIQAWFYQRGPLFPQAKPRGKAFMLSAVTMTYKLLLLWPWDRLHHSTTSNSSESCKMKTRARNIAMQDSQEICMCKGRMHFLIIILSHYDSKGSTDTKWEMDPRGCVWTQARSSCRGIPLIVMWTKMTSRTIDYVLK